MWCLSSESCLAMPLCLTLQRMTFCCSRDSMKTDVYVRIHPSKRTLLMLGDDSFTYLKVIVQHN